MDLYDLDKSFDKLLKAVPESKRKLVEHCGDKLKEKVLQNIDATVQEETGNLKSAVTKTVGSGGGYSAVKPDWKKAPHTHLIENGHKLVRGKKRDAEVIGWVAGKHMYRNAIIALADELEQDAEKVIHDLVGEIFG